MEVGDFIINGVSSRDLKTKIQRRPIIEIPQRKTVENDEVPLRSGSLLFDDEGYRNTVMPLSMYVKGSSFDEASKNRNEIVSLFQQGDYNEFVPYFDNDKTYFVRLVGGSFNGAREYGYVQPLDVVLSVKPFKRLNNSEARDVTNGGVLFNPEPYTSKPKITVVGQGNIDLIINGETTALRGVDDSIILDSDSQNAYKLNSQGKPMNRNEKMFTLDFPELIEGKNTIQWTGSVSKVTVEPRWQVLS